MGQTSQIGRVATTVHTNEQGQTQVVYHSTAVVNFKHKLIVLNHGGWMTATTKTRIEFRLSRLPKGLRLVRNIQRRTYPV